MAHLLRTKNKSRHDNSGQALVQLVIILPPIFLFWLLSLNVFKFLSFKEESVHICRQELIKYQEIHLNGIQKLYALNPKAKALRAKRKVAEAAYKFAKKTRNPKMIATTWAYLKKIKLEQKAFNGLQRSIKTSSEAAAQLQLRKAQAKIKRLHYIKQLPLTKGSYISALKKSPRASLSPDYIKRSRFEKKQNMEMHWKVTFLEKLKNKKFAAINLNCSATIKTQEDAWEVTLSHADKL